jgi:hypothetical protein
MGLVIPSEGEACSPSSWASQKDLQNQKRIVVSVFVDSSDFDSDSELEVVAAHSESTFPSWEGQKICVSGDVRPDRAGILQILCYLRVEGMPSMEHPDRVVVAEQPRQMDDGRT